MTVTFVLVNHFHCKLVLMCLDDVDTRDQILLRVACTVNSCRDIKFVRRIACLISLSQRARLAEPSVQSVPQEIIIAMYI